MEQFTYQIGLEEDEARLDKWISGALPDLSRSYIQKCIKENHVLVNQKPQKASYRLKVDDEIHSGGRGTCHRGGRYSTGRSL